MFLDLSIAENISALDLRSVSGSLFIRSRTENAVAEEMRERLGIRCSSVAQQVRTLSRYFLVSFTYNILKIGTKK